MVLTFLLLVRDVGVAAVEFATVAEVVDWVLSTVRVCEFLREPPAD